MKNRIGMPVLRKQYLRRNARLIPIVQPILVSKKSSLEMPPNKDRFKGVMVSSLEISRALDFLNSLDDAEPLAKMKTVGSTVAARIIDYKAKLTPRQKFTSLAQLKHIPGFGPTKFRELIESISV